MNIIITNEYAGDMPVNYEQIIREVCEEAIDYVACPYECSVDVLLTDNNEIHEINLSQRNIDRPTDVLSFPMNEFASPADFCDVDLTGTFDPDSGELMLGDIVISIDKAAQQAEEYGHSKERELAFLTAHSMLHLFGFDHMEESERQEMEQKQDEILTNKGYTRDYKAK